jgi:hypothetical protein
MKLIDDPLKVNGKWSIKRLAGISGFYFAVIYAFIPIWFPIFVVHEFVFWGFITFGASAIGMTVWNKKIAKENNNDDN